MAYVVTAACFGCKNTDCVTVCPVDCFREGEQMLYIDPCSCTECGACAIECPVEAIYPDVDVPHEMHNFIALNAEMAAMCPEITEKQKPLCA